MQKRRRGTALKVAAGAFVCAAVVLAALMVSPGGSGTGPGRLTVLGPQRALGGDFSGAGLGDRYVMGLFSEDVAGIMKTKIPSGEWPAIRNTRIFVQWKMIERNGKGQFSWSGLDDEINNCLSLGVNGIMLTITGPVPSWAENKSWPAPSYMGPPKNMKDWGDFCGAVAARYKDYVDWYQIWQEPGWDIDAPPAAEGTKYFTGRCDYDYMGMLRSGYQAIEAADPGDGSYVATGAMLNGITRSSNDFYNYETLLAGGNQDISMKVQCDTDIVAERPMYFNYHGSWQGGTVEQGIKEAKTTWYLAEGATHTGFEQWISVQNPNAVDTGVNITYMFPGGGTQDQYFTMKANSRYTVDVNAAVGQDRDVSAKIKSVQPVVVERPMYFNYQGRYPGGSIESGISEPSTRWYLAEGATQPGMEEWISLMNPNSSGATIKITYMFPGGGTKVQSFPMPATSRETVNVNKIVGENKDVSALVESTRPVLAERPMYFNYHGAWPGGHTQSGAVTPATSWFLAEGTTRNNSHDGAFEEWISIMNPGDAAAQVDITYMFTGGGTQAGHKTVAAHSRETISVNAAVGNDKDVSVRLSSPSQPIVVERPLYYNYKNSMAGGDVELGSTEGSKTLYFAEGTTRGGFEEWLTLQNPSGSAATATVTYMFADGTTQNQLVGLPANSRTTVGVNNSVSIATICDGIAVHPYDYPDYWAWYYQTVVNICAKNGYGGREVLVTEIGWPHSGKAEFSYEGQRRAIGEVGVGGLFGAGCRKIWIFQDVDPQTSWDAGFAGLWTYSGSVTPAWNEYKKWQSQLPDYGNKPGHSGPF